MIYESFQPTTDVGRHSNNACRGKCSSRSNTFLRDETVLPLEPWLVRDMSLGCKRLNVEVKFYTYHLSCRVSAGLQQWSALYNLFSVWFVFYVLDVSELASMEDMIVQFHWLGPWQVVYEVLIYIHDEPAML